MKCAKVRKALTDEISSAALLEVRRHLEDCPECRSFLKDLESIRELQESLSRHAQAPADFVSRMEGRLAGQTAGTSALRYWLLIIPAVVLLAAAGWSRLTPESGQQTAREVPPFSLSRQAGIAHSTDVTGEVQTSPGRTGSDYVEVIVQDADGTSYLVRIPSRIHIRRTDRGSETVTLASY